MPDPQPDTAILDERATEEQYRAVLEEKGRFFERLAIAQPRSATWTGTGALRRAEDWPRGELAGRVKLDDGEDFYIGVRYAKLAAKNASEDRYVFGWAAPIAATFYSINDTEWSGDRHSACDHVVGVRSFEHTKGMLTGLADQAVGSTPTSSLFPERQLDVPTMPPERRKLILSDVAPEDRPDGDRSTAPAPSPRKTELRDRHQPSPIRAEELVLATVTRPRSPSLSPLLSTIQSDQYELVSLDHARSVVIEGPPGTGKTVVAAHRAAFLVSEDNPASKAAHVLVVGPTSAHSEQVQGVTGGLLNTEQTRQVTVVSLPGLVCAVAGLATLPEDDRPSSWQDVDEWLSSRIARIDQSLPASDNPAAAIKAIYAGLKRLATATDVFVDDMWRDYLAALPDDVGDLRMSRRWLRAYAYIAWRAGLRPTSPDLTKITHVVVDEAQDLTAIDWLLLKEINSDTGAWTIVGDMNQRRSDHTPVGWEAIKRLVGSSVEGPLYLRRAYRSTRSILEYGNRLLRRSERSFIPLQDEGLPVKEMKVSPAGLIPAVVQDAERMLAAYPEGTVAIITTTPQVVLNRLLSLGRWKTHREGELLRWEDPEGHVLTIGTPDDVRGLEFDGVVIVEPEAFPESGGRQGPLFTSLTRANKELSVIYAKRLPEALRR